MLLPSPAAALASLMRAVYSALHLEAVQRLPASGLPLWPRQMTHDDTIFSCASRAKRQRSEPALGVAVATPAFGVHDVDVRKRGYVWICLDMSGYLDSLDVFGHVWTMLFHQLSRGGDRTFYHLPKSGARTSVLTAF